MSLMRFSNWYLIRLIKYSRGAVQALFGTQKWCYATKNKISQNCS
jgi:hypothetical protein